MPDTLTVYLYTYWDEETKTHKTSGVYATLDMIRNGLGRPVYGSELKVRRADLRDGGFYVPANASWPSVRLGKV
jgi:hypothetical protein